MVAATVSALDQMFFFVPERLDVHFVSPAPVRDPLGTLWKPLRILAVYL